MEIGEEIERKKTMEVERKWEGIREGSEEEDRNHNIVKYYFTNIIFNM